MKIICIWKIYISSLSESYLSSNLIFTWENVQWQFCLLFWQRNGKKCKVPIQKPFQWRRMRMPARFENVHDCLYAIDFLWPSLCCLAESRDGKQKVPLRNPFQRLRIHLPAQFENVLDYFHAAWFWLFHLVWQNAWRNNKQWKTIFVIIGLKCLPSTWHVPNLTSFIKLVMDSRHVKHNEKLSTDSELKI